MLSQPMSPADHASGADLLLCNAEPELVQEYRAHMHYSMTMRFQPHGPAGALGKSGWLCLCVLTWCSRGVVAMCRPSASPHVRRTVCLQQGLPHPACLQEVSPLTQPLRQTGLLAVLVHAPVRCSTAACCPRARLPGLIGP